MSRMRRGGKKVLFMNPADWIVLAIVAVLLVLAIVATKKHFGGKGGCCGCSGGCAGCSGSCHAGGHCSHPAPDRNTSDSGHAG